MTADEVAAWSDAVGLSGHGFGGEEPGPFERGWLSAIALDAAAAGLEREAALVALRATVGLTDAGEALAAARAGARRCWRAARTKPPGMRASSARSPTVCAGTSIMAGRPRWTRARHQAAPTLLRWVAARTPAGHPLSAVLAGLRDHVEGGKAVCGSEREGWKALLHGVGDLDLR